MSEVLRAKTNHFKLALKGAAIISLGGLVAKLLGAIYRIPLTNLLKGEGMGIYQMAFPSYCILLTFSSTGVPPCIAKLISSGENPKAVLYKSLKFFSAVGIVGSILMAVFSPLISSLQGNGKAYLAYIALSPSVALVSVISCFRGYFQGLNDMSPTAISQIIEQIVKLSVGLGLCSIFSTPPFILGAIACFAVSSSELIAVVFLWKKYKKSGDNGVIDGHFPLGKLIKTIVPITLSSILIPLSRFIDSFLIINILSDYALDATSLYGLYTGGVESIIGLPVALCYGAAAVALPTVASMVAIREYDEAKRQTRNSIAITLGLSAICLLGTLIFGNLAIKFLYGRLPNGDVELMSKLLKVASPTITLLSLTQTATSILIAYGKLYAPCIFLSIGILFKVILEIFLLKNPKINIFATAISDISCYLVAVFGDLVYIIIILFKKRDEKRATL